MPLLKVVDRDGREHDVPARSGQKLMETLRELDYGISAMIPAAMSDERELIAELAHHKSGSRLSCQIEMTDALDGLRVTIAPDE